MNDSRGVRLSFIRPARVDDTFDKWHSRPFDNVQADCPYIRLNRCETRRPNKRPKSVKNNVTLSEGRKRRAPAVLFYKNPTDRRAGSRKTDYLLLLCWCNRLMRMVGGERSRSYWRAKSINKVDTQDGASARTNARGAQQKHLQYQPSVKNLRVKEIKDSCFSTVPCHSICYAARKRDGMPS